MLLVAAGCTAFEGLEPGRGVTPPPTGGGGSGGEPPEAPRSLLPLLDAANLCSLVFRCPTLGGSILLSTGLPLVATDAGARPTVWNYSACIDWLTAPLENGRVGFDDLRDAIVRIAPATTCEDAASLLAFDVAEDASSLCPASGGGGAGGNDGTCGASGAVSCPSAITGHCDDDIFGVSSECKVSSRGDVRCALDAGCTTPGVTCDGAFVIDCSASGFKTALSCERYGLSCQNGAGCVTPSGPTVCSAFGEQSCGVGQRAQACAVGYPPSLQMAAVDCSAMGMACSQEGNAARCAVPGSTCSPYDPTANRCQGETAVVCVQGQSVTIDCPLLGKTCQPESTDGSQSAHCR